MEIKRSLIGTILMVLLILIRLPAIWTVYHILQNLGDWDDRVWDLIPIFSQFLVVCLYIMMLFVALKSTVSRVVGAVLMSVSFLLNQFAFWWNLGVDSWVDMLVFNLVLLDLLVIVVLCFKITNKMNYLLPFYGVETASF